MVRIRFYKPTDWVGRAIGWVTKSPYCHVAIEHTVFGTALLTQAHSGHGVYCVPLTALNGGDVAFDLPEVDEEWAFTWLVKEWGIPYGYLDIATFFAKPGRFRHENYGGLICSELATMFLAAAFEKFSFQPIWDHTARMVCAADHANASEVSPGNLFTMMSARPAA